MARFPILSPFPKTVRSITNKVDVYAEHIKRNNSEGLQVNSPINNEDLRKSILRNRSCCRRIWNYQLSCQINEHPTQTPKEDCLIIKVEISPQAMSSGAKIEVYNLHIPHPAIGSNAA